MSFYGQKIRNKFPHWSKIRTEDASVGGILFDNIGLKIENLKSDLVRDNLRKRCLEFKPVFEPGNLNIFSLSDNPDYLNYIRENKDFLSIEARDQDDNLVEFVSSYSELCRSYPTSISLNYLKEDENFTLIELTDSRISNSKFEFYKNPTRLYINILNTKVIKDKIQHPFFNGEVCLILRGRNVLHEYVEEKIYIKNDGYYESRIKFSTLEPLNKDIDRNISGGPSVEAIGFDGTVEVLKYPIQVYKKDYITKTIVKKTDDISYANSVLENVLTLELKNEANKSYFNYIARAFETAELYKKDGIQDSEDFYEQIYMTSEILNESLGEVEVMDYCFDYMRDRVVTIDVEGEISYYNINKHIMEVPRIRRTKNVDLLLEVSSEKVKELEEIKLYVSLERAKNEINFYFIGRQTPSFREDETLSLEYLQEDGSWTSDIYFFKGRDTVDKFESVRTQTFDVTIDEKGQYDFYVFSYSNDFSGDSISSYLNGDIDAEEFLLRTIRYSEKLQTNIFINTVSVFCEYLVPEKSLSVDLDADLSSKGEVPEDFIYGIHIDDADNQLYVTAAKDDKTYVYKVDERRDYLIFSYTLGEGATLETYDSLTITINSEYTEEIVNA